MNARAERLSPRHCVTYQWRGKAATKRWNYLRQKPLFNGNTINKRNSFQTFNFTSKTSHSINTKLHNFIMANYCTKFQAHNFSTSPILKPKYFPVSHFFIMTVKTHKFKSCSLNPTFYYRKFNPDTLIPAIWTRQFVCLLSHAAHATKKILILAFLNSKIN